MMYQWCGKIMYFMIGSDGISEMGNIASIENKMRSIIEYALAMYKYAALTTASWELENSQLV